MSSIIRINSITGTPPYVVYACDFYENNCQFITTLSGSETQPIDIVVTGTSLMNVPLILLKIVDSVGCIFKQTEICANFPSPTPTMTQTPTNTITPTYTPPQTPTNTITPTYTPSQTPTITQTPTVTQTQTPTITQTQTQTLTQTPTTTFTPTNTITPTMTPSITPSITPTNTQTPTVSPSSPGCWLYRASTNQLLVQNFDFVDCGGTPSQGQVGNGFVNFCAQYGSPFTLETVTFTLSGACPTYYGYNFNYDSLTCPCFTLDGPTYYSYDYPLTVGSVLYTSIYYGALNDPAPNGVYAQDGTDCYAISGGTGVIWAISACIP